MRFFLDNCISKAMAVAIGALAESQGHQVVHLTRDFDASTTDTEWIPRIRTEGYVIVSGDPRIARNPANRAAWIESGLTAFFLATALRQRSFGSKRKSSSGGSPKSLK